MKRIIVILSMLVTVLILFSCIPISVEAEETSIPHGQEDLSRLTYKELQSLQSDISSAYEAYHTPTDAQKKRVLTATQSATQKYYSDRNIEVSGWAWYNREYTYTKDWDFYTLKTHLDYKGSDKNSYRADIYSEVYHKDGQFIVAYLKTDNTVILDSRSDYGNTQWFSKPSTRINKSTGIDLSTYTAKELTALNNKAKKEIDKNHSVSKNEASIILALTKSDLEQYCLKKNMEIKSYAWYDSEYTYTKDWDYYWLETHVDYTTSPNASKQTSKLYSEVCKINGEYELVSLKLGFTSIKDKRKDLFVSSDDGIPRYSWTSADENKVENTKAEDVTESIPSVTPQIIYVTPEPVPETTMESVPSNGIFTVELAELSDEQLIEAAEAIQTEQRARIKTKINLSETDIILPTGKTKKIEAAVVDLPEGEKTPKLEWSTSDKSIATCSNGTIKGVSGGSATITCFTSLADGTHIYAECTVQVVVPVNSIASTVKSLNLNGGHSIQLIIKIKPENATIQVLSFESSNEQVATVDNNGMIVGVGDGTATITISTTDGSNKSITIPVKVVDHRISLETVKKVVSTGLGNYWADDVYTSDGNNYDKKKFHSNGHLTRSFSVYDEGKWTSSDNGNTWHVEDLILQHKIYKGFFMYDFDIRFDGKNYYMENGWSENAGKLEWLESKDPSKWGESDLSNLDFYSCFVISPSLVK